jgi:hypothetical protein
MQDTYRCGVGCVFRDGKAGENVRLCPEVINLVRPSFYQQILDRRGVRQIGVTEIQSIEYVVYSSSVETAGAAQTPPDFIAFLKQKLC